MTHNRVLSCHKTDLIRLIREAKKVLFLAAPGLSNDIVNELIDASHRLGRDNVAILIDSHSQAERQGYGQIEALEILLAENIQVYHTYNFRIGFIRSDNYSLQFTPLSELLEAPQPFIRRSNFVNSYGRQGSLFDEFQRDFEPIFFTNAISINLEDATAIIRALVPALEDKLKLWNNDIETPNPSSSAIDENITESIETDKTNKSSFSEFGVYKLFYEDLERTKQDLTANPPVPASIARKTRVLNSRFQFMEIEFKGAKLSKRQLTLKPVDIGIDPSQAGDNLSGVWKVLDKKIDDQIKPLEARLKVIRDKYLHSIPDYGSIILCQDRQKFDKEMTELQNKVSTEMKNLESIIKNLLEESRTRLKSLMVKSLEDSYNKGENLKDKKWSTIRPEARKDYIENIIEQRLNKKYPTVASILSNVGLDWNIFNISEQIMQKDSFVLAIKEIFRVGIEDLVKSEEAIVFET